MNRIRMAVLMALGCSLLSPASSAAPLPAVSCASAQQVATFDFTGAPQTFDIPAGIVSSLTVEARGAQGAPGSVGTGPGTGGLEGLGSIVHDVIELENGGGSLTIVVGGMAVGAQGGYNGGANGGNALAGGGGGASDIRVGPDLTDRIIVAAGGGGGGRGGCETQNVTGGRGGNGDQPGLSGTDAPTSGGSAGGGFGGTLPGGGGAGIGCGGFLGTPGQSGTNGSGGHGGDGQTCCCFSSNSIPGGGGGGGGWLGGGGGGGGSAGTVGCSGNDKGAGGGGSGGSSLYSATYGTLDPASHTGHGQVRLCFNLQDAIFSDGFEQVSGPLLRR